MSLISDNPVVTLALGAGGIKLSSLIGQSTSDGNLLSAFAQLGSAGIVCWLLYIVYTNQREDSRKDKDAAAIREEKADLLREKEREKLFELIESVIQMQASVTVTQRDLSATQAQIANAFTEHSKATITLAESIKELSSASVCQMRGGNQQQNPPTAMTLIGQHG